jgi:hypothetical protein
MTKRIDEPTSASTHPLGWQTRTHLDLHAPGVRPAPPMSWRGAGVTPAQVPCGAIPVVLLSAGVVVRDRAAGQRVLDGCVRRMRRRTPAVQIPGVPCGVVSR